MHKPAAQSFKVSPGGKLTTMENQPKEQIESLFERAKDYLETRLELFKLKAVNKSSDVISSIASRVVFFVIMTFFVLILNIGIALLLGELLGKSYYGFFTLAGFYLIAGLIFFSFRHKWVKTPVTDIMIKKFLK